jgi:hypothetical protein
VRVTLGRGPRWRIFAHNWTHETRWLKDKCGSDMLEQLLSDTGPSIFGTFKLANPVINRRVEFRKGFLLLENGLVGEASDTGGT